MRPLALLAFVLGPVRIESATIPHPSREVSPSLLGYFSGCPYFGRNAFDPSFFLTLQGQRLEE
jgi:hypothetical protein